MAIARKQEQKKAKRPPKAAAEKISSLRHYYLPKGMQNRIEIPFDGKDAEGFEEYDRVAVLADDWMEGENPTVRVFFSARPKKKGDPKVQEVVVLHLRNGFCRPPGGKDAPGYENEREVASVVHAAIEPLVEMLLRALPEKEERSKPRPPERPALKVEPETADEPEAEDTEPDAGNGDTGEDANGDGNNHEEGADDAGNGGNGNGDEGEAEADPETPVDTPEDAPADAEVPAPEHLCFRCGKALSPERIAELQDRRIREDRWDHQECYMSWRSSQKAAPADKGGKADKPKGGKPEGKKAKS